MKIDFEFNFTGWRAVVLLAAFLIAGFAACYGLLMLLITTTRNFGW